MASNISFTGLSSGLDTKSIIAALMSIERRPVDRLEAKVEAKNQYKTIISDLKSKLTALKSAAQAMDTAAEFKKVSSTSSDEDIVTVTTTSNASPGRHTIKVTQLARAEMEVSQGYSSKSDIMGTGTFTITQDGEEYEITLNTANNTLEGLKNAINASDADVTASIINDGTPGSPYRLVVTADETGTENSFVLDASGLSGGTAPTFTDGTGGTPGQTALDSTFVFDGVNVTKSSNSVTDLLDGITINLKDVDDTKTVDLTFTSNAEQIRAQVQSFITAYNDLYDYIVSKKGTDTVKGDSTIGNVLSSLQSTIISNVQGLNGDFTNLAHAGITTRSGKLEMDEEKFDEALEDYFEDVAKIFVKNGESNNAYVSFVNSTGKTQPGTYAISITGVGGSFGGTINGHAATTIGGSYLLGATGQSEEGLTVNFSGSEAGDYGSVTFSLGIMEMVSRKIDSYIDSAEGLLTTKTQTLDSSIRSLKRQIDTKEEQLTKVEARLTRQYSKLESSLSSLQTQGSYISMLGSSIGLMRMLL